MQTSSREVLNDPKSSEIVLTKTSTEASQQNPSLQPSGQHFFNFHYGKKSKVDDVEVKSEKIEPSNGAAVASTARPRGQVRPKLLKTKSEGGGIRVAESVPKTDVNSIKEMKGPQTTKRGGSFSG